MNYQNQFIYRNKDRWTFSQRVYQKFIKQLIAVIVLTLILFSLNHATSIGGSLILQRGKEMFYLDYTSQVAEVFKTYSTDVEEFITGLANKIQHIKY